MIALFEAHEKLDRKPLPRSFAKHIIHIAKHESLAKWLDELPIHADTPETAQAMRVELDKILDPDETISPEAITFSNTARREFEEQWWADIHFLAHGKFLNKDNADTIQDPVTLNMVAHQHRDLEILVIIPGKNRFEAVVMADHYDITTRRTRWRILTSITGQPLPLSLLKRLPTPPNHYSAKTHLLEPP